MKHTPGPWTAIKSNNGHDIVALVLHYNDHDFINDAHLYRVPGKEDISWKMGRDGDLYASLSYETWRQFNVGSWDEQQEANSKLIAAAPDLLAVCQQLIEFADKWRNSLALPIGAEYRFHDVIVEAARAAVQKAESNEER